MFKTLKKYSIQMAILTSLAGVVITVMPYFESYLEQWQMGLVMTLCGVLTALGRMIPQK
ncbi:TMhelix containing protein [Vibrio phage 1.244.A._10N.261.54.C3]|nr:TMhelix containing protein [Vibrio phage 1.244.A._10N.261.54.C3]AUR98756.1 TMhelix containing protein [Vibrio phage 1.255.O._10N.286.45.F1]